VTLVELPGNAGRVFAVDPHAVTAVAPCRSTLAGRGMQTFDMSAVWMHDRQVIVCAWSVESTLAALNAVRRGEADAFAAGYTAGILEDESIDDVEGAWTAYLETRGSSS